MNHRPSTEQLRQLDNDCRKAASEACRLDKEGRYEDAMTMSVRNCSSACYCGLAAVAFLQAIARPARFARSDTACTHLDEQAHAAARDLDVDPGLALLDRLYLADRSHARS